MEIKIRKATLDDFDKIRELNSRLFTYDGEFDDTLDHDWPHSDKGEKYFKKRITDKEESLALVAESEGKIIGYLIGALADQQEYRKDVEMAELENMLVLDNHRRKGVGKGLFDEFLKWCKDNKVKRLRVTASAKNARAIAFYKRQGYKEHDLILEKDI